jgi:hypothetical protein
MQCEAEDDVFRALADEPRRVVVRYLRTEADGTASYEEVADHVTARCRDPPAEPMVALEHTILPMLSEAGLVRNDHDNQRVRYRGSEVAEVALDVVGEE